MKVFISADIEGTCGASDFDETELGKYTHLFMYLREQMTREAAAAANGALSAGADEVFVKDAHDTGMNIIPTGLPRKVKLHRSWTGDLLSMASGLTPEFAGAAFTGYHSPAYSDMSPLAHTMNGGVYEITINGERASEFHLHAYAAGMLGVPILFLSGDKGICDIAERFCPGIVTVATFEGTGGATVSIHPDEACEQIERGMAEAVKRGGYKIKMPERFDIAVQYRSHEKALRSSFYPGCKRVDEKKIAFTVDNYEDALRAFKFVL
ncbi:MAG: M55 family metallopeptidase [Oscillospiraceae bacterium]|jgi:D-amino peptidase|nr:M55 family metallopeptidase [Oscillospiraceae bacterium]